MVPALSLHWEILSSQERIQNLHSLLLLQARKILPTKMVLLLHSNKKHQPHQTVTKKFLKVYRMRDHPFRIVNLQQLLPCHKGTPWIRTLLVEVKKLKLTLYTIEEKRMVVVWRFIPSKNRWLLIWLFQLILLQLLYSQKMIAHHKWEPVVMFCTLIKDVIYSAKGTGINLHFHWSKYLINRLFPLCR